MRTLTLALVTAASALTSLTAACVSDDGPIGYAGDYRSYNRYDWDRPDPSYHGYYADRYYVDNPRYQERVLTGDDRIYMGHDGRYYCRRSDGTTGLIVGGIAGGALGAALTAGSSQPLGILLGAAAGAVAGNAIDRDNVRCR